MSKNLTDKQMKFLDALLSDECKGSYLKAKRAAGYAETVKVKEVVDSLKDEIIEATKNYIIVNGPKAAMALKEVLEDPVQLGNGDKLKAAKEVLDRAGIKPTEKVEIATKSPIFILPSKDAASE